MNIYIGSDHSGYKLKNEIILNFKLENNEYKEKINFVDVFCVNGERCDYPDCAKEVCKMVLEDKGSIGIVICETGIGISIASNKIKGINCALCYNKYTGMMAKKHNNANIIALGGRVINKDTALKIIYNFLNNDFEGGKHIQRLNKLII